MTRSSSPGTSDLSQIEVIVLEGIGDTFPAEPPAGLHFYTYRIDLAAGLVVLRVYVKGPEGPEVMTSLQGIESELVIRLGAAWRVTTEPRDTNEGQHPDMEDRKWFPKPWPKEIRDETVPSSQVRAWIAMEWPEKPIAPLLACSFLIDQPARRIWLKALTETPLSEDQWFEIDEFGGYMYSHLLDDWFVDTLFGCRPQGAFFPGDDTIVFRKGDTGPQR